LVRLRIIEQRLGVAAEEGAACHADRCAGNHKGFAQYCPSNSLPAEAYQRQWSLRQGNRYFDSVLIWVWTARLGGL
jgi:hypothetical protein